MKNYKSAWKSLSNNMTPIDVVNYCLLKAINAKHEDKLELSKIFLAQAFTPITNKTKLNNGATPYQSLKGALYSLKLYTNWKGGNDMKIFGQSIEEFFETPDEFETYKGLVSALYDYDHEKLNRQYCYIFVDTESVTPEQAMVQAAHATMVVGSVAEFAHNPHEIFFQIVDRPIGMSAVDLQKRHKKLRFHHFAEPDLGGKVIASAITPIPWWKREDLKQYPLVSFQKSA